jgi:endonuclease YncB( thermonuclease family)
MRRHALRLSLLAPDILEGRTEQALMLERLEQPLPAIWDEQRQRVLTVLAVDDYDRRSARCELAGEDLSRWLVANGLAMAFRQYSERFVPEGESARDARVGLWHASFEPPWEYRAERWRVAAGSPQGMPD